MAIKASDLIKPAAAAGGGQQRRITISDAVRYLAGDDGGHQQARIVLQAPAELEPGELERLSAEIKQYALEPEPTDAERQMIDRVKAEADRFMLVSPEEAERLRAQIDNPFLLSPGEARRMTTQLTSSMAPTTLGEYAAELMRPLQDAYSTEYLSAWAEPIRRAMEPSGLSAALAAQAAALGIVHQALNPMALDMISTTMEMMREQSKQMAEMAASWAQPFGAMDVGRAALSLSRDLQMAQNALRNSGFSLGLLDDTNQALGRLYEQRQAPPARRPEPPAERVQVVHLAPGDVLEALTLMLQNGDVAPGDVAACLYSFSTEQRQAGLYPPDWPVIAAVVALYKEHGANLHTQQNFVSWLIDSAKGRALGLGSISLSTFQRYLATWEQNTGEQVRPGKGRRKRGAQL